MVAKSCRAVSNSASSVLTSLDAEIEGLLWEGKYSESIPQLRNRNQSAHAPSSEQKYLTLRPPLATFHRRNIFAHVSLYK
jgi:hypothetical protein